MNSAIVYWQAWRDGKCQGHGNFQSTYNATEDIISNWGDFVTSTTEWKKGEVFFVGVFKL